MKNTFSVPLVSLAGRAFRLLTVVWLAFLALSAPAALVSFVITNQMTGLPDTNSILIQGLNPNANADGSYNSIGLPFRVFPPCATNLYHGIYIASNKFIVQNMAGPGMPGSQGGIIFAVDNTTNAYSFLRYPQSGYGVANWYVGISSANGTNGINTGITNGVLTIDGSGITASVSSNGIVGALGYLPPSLPVVTNTEAAYIAAQGLASSNYTTAQILASNIIVQSNIASTNSATLQTVTNFVLSSIAASNSQVLSAIASTNLANLTTTTNFVLSSIASSNAQIQLNISATNYSNLAITTNLVINASNNTVANLNSTIYAASNGAVASGIVLLTAGTNAVNAGLFAASNTLAANAQYSLSVSNSAQSAALTASNVYLVGVINTSSNAGQNFTLSVSNQTATALSYAIGASNRTTSNLGVIVVVSNAAFGAQAYAQGVSNLWISGSNNFLGIINASSNAAIVSAQAGTAGSQSVLSNYVFSALASSNLAQVALVNQASNQNSAYSSSISNTLLNSVVASNSAGNLYTLGVSNLVVNNFAFGKGVSNSLVAGTNTLALWSLDQIQASNAAVASVASANLNSASNYLSTNLNATIASSAFGSAVLATNLSGVERAAMVLTNILSINQASNTAQAITIASNFLQNLQYAFGTNWVSTNIAAQMVVSNFNLLAITTNLNSSLSNNLLSVIATNFINSTNYSASLQTNFITTGTNYIGLSYGSSCNGTYQQATATTWTNYYQPEFSILLSGGNYYAKSNGVTYYAFSSIPGTGSLVGGLSPAPSIYWGRLVNLNGQLLAGWGITNQSGGGSVSTNGLATTNYVISSIMTATNGLGAVPTNGAVTGQFYEYGSGWVGISTGTGITTNYGGPVSLQFPLNVLRGTNSIFTNSTLSGTFYGNGTGITNVYYTNVLGSPVTSNFITAAQGTNIANNQIIAQRAITNGALMNFSSGNIGSDVAGNMWVTNINNNANLYAQTATFGNNSQYGFGNLGVAFFSTGIGFFPTADVTITPYPEKLGANGEAYFATNLVHIYTNGTVQAVQFKDTSGTLPPSNLILTNGSAGFAVGGITNASSNWQINPDGSASFEGNNFTIGTFGNVSLNDLTINGAIQGAVVLSNNIVSVNVGTVIGSIPGGQISGAVAVAAASTTAVFSTNAKVATNLVSGASITNAALIGTATYNGAQVLTNGAAIQATNTLIAAAIVGTITNTLATIGALPTVNGVPVLTNSTGGAASTNVLAFQAATIQITNSLILTNVSGTTNNWIYTSAGVTNNGPLTVNGLVNVTGGFSSLQGTFTIGGGGVSGAQWNNTGCTWNNSLFMNNNLIYGLYGNTPSAIGFFAAQGAWVCRTNFQALSLTATNGATIGNPSIATAITNMQVVTFTPIAISTLLSGTQTQQVLSVSQVTTNRTAIQIMPAQDWPAAGALVASTITNNGSIWITYTAIGATFNYSTTSPWHLILTQY
jgi:hypothetical protein